MNLRTVSVIIVTGDVRRAVVFCCTSPYKVKSKTLISLFSKRKPVVWTIGRTAFCAAFSMINYNMSIIYLLFSKRNPHSSVTLFVKEFTRKNSPLHFLLSSDQITLDDGKIEAVQKEFSLLWEKEYNCYFDRLSITSRNLLYDQ